MEEKPITKRLLILYASETGNAMDAAERLGREAERRCCPVAVRSIDDFDPVCTSYNLLLTKTYILVYLLIELSMLLIFRKVYLWKER